MTEGYKDKKIPLWVMAAIALLLIWLVVGLGIHFAASVRQVR